MDGTDLDQIVTRNKSKQGKKNEKKKRKKKNEATASYTVCIPQVSLPISFLSSTQKT